MRPEWSYQAAQQTVTEILTSGISKSVLPPESVVSEGWTADPMYKPKALEVGCALQVHIFVLRQCSRYISKQHAAATENFGPSGALHRATHTHGRHATA